MRDKTSEQNLVVKAVDPVQSAVAATLYNGSAVSISNNGIDTKAFKSVMFSIHAGTFVGAAALDVAIVANTVDNPLTATLVSGHASPSNTADTDAEFTQITIANDAQVHTAAIQCENFNRYMWVRSYQNAHTVNFEAIAILGNSDRSPQDNSLVFDLNY